MDKELDKESQAALMLHFYKKLSPSNILELYQQVGSLSGILTTSNWSDVWPPSLLQSLECLDQQRGQLEQKADEVLVWCKENHIHLLTIAQAGYPPLLKEIASPPIILFVQGNVDVLSLPQIAIVGSRHGTGSGLNTAFEFAKMLADSGFVITSGLALGIDGAAHKGALETGKTVAVLGAGSDIIYPKRHSGIQQKIIEGGGAVITEFLPGTPPLPAHFPRRNRIISGLSLGTMVVEAALKSGSLITTKYAMEQGREVFAIPGSIHNVLSKGAHSLIKQGATLVESAADIVEQLGGLLGHMELGCSAKGHTALEQIASESLPPPSVSKPSGRSDKSEHQILLNAIGFDPVDMDTLVERTGWTVIELNHQLMKLELEGIITNQNGMYDRCE